MEPKKTTVAEIKEYIDENTKGIYERTVDSVFDTPSFRRTHETLENVKSMLDDIKTNAKWVKTSLSYYDDDYGWECSNALMN